MTARNVFLFVFAVLVAAWSMLGVAAPPAT
jgi:hypothetical protein